MVMASANGVAEAGSAAIAAGTDPTIYASVSTAFVTGGTAFSHASTHGLVAENVLLTDGGGFVTGGGGLVPGGVGLVPGGSGLATGTAATVAGGAGFVAGGAGFVVGVVGSDTGATVFGSGVTAFDSGAAAFGSGATALESAAAGMVTFFPDSICVALISVFGELGSLDCWFGVASVPTVFCSVFCKFPAMLAIGWLAAFAAWLDDSALGALALGALPSVSAVAMAPPPLPMRRPADSTQAPATERKSVVEMISSVLERPHRRVNRWLLSHSPTDSYHNSVAKSV